MKIKINNCSSPGASFTKNTEDVILSCYEWIQENKNVQKLFINFRREVSTAKKFNDNNARNIYPLLLKVGFVNYQAGSILNYNNFFTRLGEAYVKAIQLERNIKNSNEHDKKIKEKALVKAIKVKEGIVYKGILNLINADSNYKNEIIETLKYILEYQKINKYEFAYLLYTLQNNKCIEESVIQEYRNKKIIIDVEVNVRNDIELRAKNGNSRNEGIDFLTSYSYFVSLFAQSGLIVKKKDYYEIKIENKSKVNNLVRS